MVNCMKIYLSDYINECENKLKGKINKYDIEELLNKISFFQHERLVHLIVTFFCAIIAILFFILSLNIIYFLIVGIIMLVLVIFYIFHYYFLENSVQKLYKIYDDMNKKIN